MRSKRRSRTTAGDRAAKRPQKKYHSSQRRDAVPQPRVQHRGMLQAGGNEHALPAHLALQQAGKDTTFNMTIEHRRWRETERERGSGVHRQIREDIIRVFCK